MTLDAKNTLKIADSSFSKPIPKIKKPRIQDKEVIDDQAVDRQLKFIRDARIEFIKKQLDTDEPDSHPDDIQQSVYWRLPEEVEVKLEATDISKDTSTPAPVISDEAASVITTPPPVAVGEFARVSSVSTSTPAPVFIDETATVQLQSPAKDVSRGISTSPPVAGGEIATVLSVSDETLRVLTRDISGKAEAPIPSEGDTIQQTPIAVAVPIQHVPIAESSGVTVTPAESVGKIGVMEIDLPKRVSKYSRQKSEVVFKGDTTEYLKIRAEVAKKLNEVKTEEEDQEADELVSSLTEMVESRKATKFDETLLRPNLACETCTDEIAVTGTFFACVTCKATYHRKQSCLKKLLHSVDQSGSLPAGDARSNLLREIQMGLACANCKKRKMYGLLCRNCKRVTCMDCFDDSLAEVIDDDTQSDISDPPTA
jgi:hypothetical protein